MKITHVNVGKANDRTAVRTFTLVSFKQIGALQIGLGVLCILLGVVDLVLFLCISSHYDNVILNSLTVSCFPVWCGIWFIVTGVIGVCLATETTDNPSFNMTYFIMCVLICVLFGPACCAVEVYIVVLRYDEAKSAHEWLIPLFLGVFAFIEMILVVITVFICCCCAPLNFWETRVPYTKQTNDSHGFRDEKHPSRLFEPVENGWQNKMQHHEPMNPWPVSHVSVYPDKREDCAKGSGEDDESKRSSVFREEWQREQLRETNTPPRRWLLWHGGIPSLARVAQASVAWKNKIEKFEDKSEAL